MTTSGVKALTSPVSYDRGMTALREILAKNVSMLRKARGWSQNDLAELADTSYVHISRIENSHSWASDELITRIAKAFKMPAEHLFASGGTLPPDLVDQVATLAKTCGLKIGRS